MEPAISINRPFNTIILYSKVPCEHRWPSDAYFPSRIRCISMQIVHLRDILQFKLSAERGASTDPLSRLKGSSHETSSRRFCQTVYFTHIRRERDSEELKHFGWILRSSWKDKPNIASQSLFNSLKHMSVVVRGGEGRLLMQLPRFVCETLFEHHFLKWVLLPSWIYNALVYFVQH